MDSRARIASVSLVLAATTLAGGALAQELPFRAGRFLADDREVFNGTFDRDLRIDSLTIGEGMFRATRNELLPASTIRVMVDTTGRGAWRVLSERELMSGFGPVRFAHGARTARTALDAFSARHLDRLFFSDGTANVRIDLLMTTGLYDSGAGRSDATPEMVIAGNLRGGNARLGAIIGGNVDEPILARRIHALDTNSLQRAETGISVVLNDQPASVGMVGLDLSDAFDVQPGVAAIGYRLELDRGATGFFTMFGSGLAEQLVGNEPSLIEDPEEREFLGATGGGGGGGAPVYGGGRGMRQISGANTPGDGYRFHTSTLGFRGTGGLGGSSFDLEAYLDFLRRLRDLQEPPIVEEPPVDDGSGNGDDDGKTGEDDGKGTDTPDREPPDVGGEDRDLDVDLRDLDTHKPRAPIDAKRVDGPLGGSIGSGEDGDVLPNSIPAPGALTLIGLAALVSRRRSRQ